MRAMTRGAGLAATALTCWMAGATTASASLIYLGTTEQLGSGIGGVATILSFQSSGSGSEASAAIVRNGASDQVLLGGDTNLNGGSNNRTRLFSEVGIDAADQFALFWNITEPGNDTFVHLNALSVTFYGEDNLPIHTATFDTRSCQLFDCDFQQVGGGVGITGHLFGLDAAQAAIISAYTGTFGSIRVGLGQVGDLVWLDEEHGAFETFSLARLGGDNVVPEPASLLLLGLGALGFAARLRRRT